VGRLHVTLPASSIERWEFLFAQILCYILSTEGGINLERSVESIEAQKLFAVGTDHFEQRRFKDAFENFEQARKLDPSLEDLDSYLGFTLFNLQKISEAITALRRASQKEPDNGRIFLHLGLCYGTLKDARSAEHYFKKGLEKNPLSGDLHFNLGTLYLNLDVYGLAEDHLKIASELSPKHSAPYHNLGIVYARTGQLELAAEAYRKSLEAEPGDLITMECALRAYLRLPAPDEWSKIKEAIFIEHPYSQPMLPVNPLDPSGNDILKF
jgi:tetratricopeptide (TPR) repeat protein